MLQFILDLTQSKQFRPMINKILFFSCFPLYLATRDEMNSTAKFNRTALAVGRMVAYVYVCECTDVTINTNGH